MKRLISFLIAILTMLLGGVRTAEETPTPETAPVAVEITAPETERHETEATVVETEPDAELPTEKEKDVPVTEADTYEPDEPCIIETEPQQSTDSIIPSFQQTDSDKAAEKETAVAAEPSVTSEQPDTVPPASIPTAEETEPVLTKKETEKETESELPANGKAPVFIDPCQDGPNPFEDSTPTEIDDHSSDEFIGDGDRPGEGIHF